MSDPHVFRPAGDCSLRSARDLKERLAAALAAADALVLDCGGVARADLSFVQVVVSAQRTARRDDKALRVSNLSEAARSAFARAGLPEAGPSPLTDSSPVAA